MCKLNNCSLKLIFISFLLTTHTLVLVNGKMYSNILNILEIAIVRGIRPNFFIFPSFSSDYDILKKDNLTATRYFQSSPGCPSPIRGVPWIYFASSSLKNDMKCYLAGFQGPCPDNMILIPKKNWIYGYCDCNCIEFNDKFQIQINSPTPASAPSSRAYCIGRVKVKNGVGRRILAFDKKSRKCHALFEQGDCSGGEWLVFGNDPTQGPICEPRKCPAEEEDSTNKLSFRFFNSKTGFCHQIGDKCLNFMKGMENQDQDDLVWHLSKSKYSYQLDTGSWQPICKKVLVTDEFKMSTKDRMGMVGEIGILDCKPNERYSHVLKRCLKNIIVGVQKGKGKAFG